MEEKKQALSYLELADVNGGTDDPQCPRHINSPIRSCASFDCPYVSGSFCSYHNEVIPKSSKIHVEVK